jgi:hypothetical protein
MYVTVHLGILNILQNSTPKVNAEFGGHPWDVGIPYFQVSHKRSCILASSEVFRSMQRPKGP